MPWWASGSKPALPLPAPRANLGKTARAQSGPRSAESCLQYRSNGVTTVWHASVQGCRASPATRILMTRNSQNDSPSVPGMPLAKSPEICMEPTSLETRRKQESAQQCPWQAGVRRRLPHGAGHATLMSGPAACWGCLGAPPWSGNVPQAWPQGL